MFFRVDTGQAMTGIDPTEAIARTTDRGRAPGALTPALAAPVLLTRPLARATLRATTTGAASAL